MCVQYVYVCHVCVYTVGISVFLQLMCEQYIYSSYQCVSPAHVFDTQEKHLHTDGTIDLHDTASPSRRMSAK